MTSEKLPEEYLQWIEDENKISSDLYTKYLDEKTSGKDRASAPILNRKHTIIPISKSLLRFAAAAVLILALGTTMWVKKDDIFKPKFTEEQIALSYDQTLRALAVCANSLGNEMGKIKKLNQIPESLNDIKELITLINN